MLSRSVIPAPFAMCATCNKDSSLGDLVNRAIRNRSWNFFFIEPDDTVSRLVTSRGIFVSQKKRKREREKIKDKRMVKEIEAKEKVKKKSSDTKI